MNNPVGWFEIYVHDMTRAKAFYTAVFGAEFTHIASPGMELFAFGMDQTSYGAAGALVHMPGLDAGSNSVLVYFRSEDCNIEIQKAIAAGGRVQKAKTSISPNGHIALIIDTEGNMIGLHSTH
jgi:predicted enzyme related to lactoylglutathione lyase